MLKRILTALTALTVLTSGLAGAGAVAVDIDARQVQQGEAASVTFANQTTGGDTVTVDEVTLPNGGYVTIHGPSLADGDALGSVAGTSAYLGPGTHDNVTVTLTDPVSEGSYTAMAHQETDGDRTYEFVASNATVDGPYTADGGAVVDSATVTPSATVSMSDQPTTGDSVVVDRVVLSEGGFVTIHDATVTEGGSAVVDSIRGTSAYLSAGVHEDVRVSLADPLSENTTLVPMAHRDTDGNETYTFPENTSTDGPYTNADGAVTDTAVATVSDTATADMSDQVTGGHSVAVDSVFLPEGGFVTIHDSTVASETFDSVRGTSTYLEPGYHTDVSVMLEDPVTNDSTLVAMPHTDSDGDTNYTFVESDGGADGPYSDDSGAVTDTASVTISATVTMSDQLSGGSTVIVDSVDMSEGGFVAIHGPTGTVVGASDYLDAGVHEGVTVTLDERLTSSQALVAMPHYDTDGDQTYEFGQNGSEADGPYVADGGPVVDSANVAIEASVAFAAQSTDGESVTVESVTLQDGGFVTIHDATLLDGKPLDSIRGTSAYLGPGTHEDVTVTLDVPLSENTTLIPMAHRDTDGDESYTFAESGATADGPYATTGGAGAVIASAPVTVETTDGDVDDGEEMDQTTEEMTGMDNGTAATTTGGSGPGFTVMFALLAVLASALLALRSRR